MLLHSYVSPIGSCKARQGEAAFSSLQRSLQRTVEDAFGSLSAATQAKPMTVRLDVKEDDKAYHVTADLPGLTENEVEVTFDNGLLTIRGEKKIERDDKKDTWHIVERSYGSFARQLALNVDIEVNKIEAKFDKGVLQVTLPKAPPAQPTAKKINIKTA